MGNYIPHRHSNNRRMRRAAESARSPVSANPADTAERLAEIARERARQARRETEKRARLMTRRQTRETQQAEADRLETMARNDTFPWEATKPFIKIVESSGYRFNRSVPYTSRAAFWGARLVFGSAMGGVYTSLCGVAITPEQKLLSSVTCPYTLDFGLVEPVLEFLLALTSHLNSANEPTTYRAAATTCARLMIEHRGEVADRIRRGEDFHGQQIHELAAGWFQFRARISDLPSGTLTTGAVYFDGRRAAIMPAGTALVRRDA